MSKTNKDTFSKKCKSCMYRASTEVPWQCDYIALTGESRCCEPGELCNKYKKGDRIKISTQPILATSKSSVESYLDKFNEYFN